MQPRSGGLTHYTGRCETCGKEWGTRNVMGLAAQHAARNPEHAIWVEVGYSYQWGPR